MGWVPSNSKILIQVHIKEQSIILEDKLSYPVKCETIYNSSHDQKPYWHLTSDHRHLNHYGLRNDIVSCTTAVHKLVE